MTLGTCPKCTTDLTDEQAEALEVSDAPICPHCSWAFDVCVSEAIYGNPDGFCAQCGYRHAAAIPHASNPLEGSTLYRANASDKTLSELIEALELATSELQSWKGFHLGLNGGFQDQTASHVIALSDCQRKLNETLAHGGVSFELEQESPARWESYQSVWSEALELAIGRAVSNGLPVTLSILCATKEAHASFGLGEHYDDEASVSEQLVIRVESLGMIP